MLGSDIELLEAPVDESWMRDHGPTFVVDLQRPNVLGAVSWVFNGWGAHEWAQWEKSAQLDPRRNPNATREGVEAELERTIGATNTIWLPRGLTRDYEEFGTNGHIDIIATIASPGTILVHSQPNPSHPDHRVVPEIRAGLSTGATLTTSS